jgi:transposase
METRQRRSFTDDYKRQAVDLVASSGRSIGSVAKELGLRDSVLRRWVEQRGAGREPTAASRRPTTQAALPSADQAAEISRLQRENERLRMERDGYPIGQSCCPMHIAVQGGHFGPEATAQEIGPSSGFMSRQCLWCAGRMGRSVDHRQCVRI